MLRTPHYSLTWLLFLGVYIANWLPKEGNLRMPVAVGGMAAVALLLLNVNKIRLSHLIWILSLITLALISLLLRAYTLPKMTIEHHLMNQLTSWVVFVYSIGIGYAAYLELVQWDRERVERMFHVLVLILLMGATLEIIIPVFKTLSDSFRLAVFEQGVYMNDVRDIKLYGAIRPKLFTSEPSHLAKYFAFFSVCWLFVTTKTQKYLLFFCYVSAGMLLIRSPIILIAPVIGLASLVVTAEKTRFGQKVFLIILLFIVLMPLGFIIAEDILMPRLERIASGQDTSFIIRFLAPLRVMTGVISDYPFLGLGFGAKEIGLTYMNEAVAGLSKIERVVSLNRLGHNFVFISVIELGLAGFVILLVLLWRMLRTFAQRHLIMLTITMLGFMQATGTLNSFRIWFFLFVLCAVSYVCGRTEYVEDKDPLHNSGFPRKLYRVEGNH